jgi:hypothetical protein
MRVRNPYVSDFARRHYVEGRAYIACLQLVRRFGGITEADEILLRHATATERAGSS